MYVPNFYPNFGEEELEQGRFQGTVWAEIGIKLTKHLHGALLT